MSIPANGGHSVQADYLNLAPTNSDSRPVPVLCLDTSRCRACLFPIEGKNEDVLAVVTSDDQVSTAFRLKPRPCHSRIFMGCSNMAFMNCVSHFCKHPEGLAVAFNADCARMATRLGRPLNEYRHCTEYSYQPTKEHQRRRRDSIRNLIETSLRESFGKLPLELWKIVSDDNELIRLYTLAEMSLRRRQKDWSIGLKFPVWATYTTIDSVEYVSSFSNSQTTKARRVCQDIKADTVLYISSDHLGIRQMLTDPKLAILDEDYPAYWQLLSVESQTLSFKGDKGYRLREVVRPPARAPVFWPSPSLPTPLALFHPGWGEGQIVARMRPLTFNEPDTTGYSICWAGTEMDAIQAHRKTDGCSRRGVMTSRERSEYEEMGNSKWTYHPIAEGEYVKQVWLRDCIQYDTVEELPYPKADSRFHYHISTPWGIQMYKGLARHKRPSDIALALVTSKGRTIVVGNHPNHGFHAPGSEPKRKWILVSETETHAPMTIFVALPTHGIPLFAASKLSSNEQRQPPTKQSSIGRMPRFNPLFTLHYSSASLVNVTSVTVCRSPNARDEGRIRHFVFGESHFDEWKYKKVAGLLFKYADGHEESVGCFRFDWIEPPVDTRGTKGLFVGEKPGRIEQIQSHVADVDIQPPEGMTEWTWKELPWDGILEWWFNPDSLDTSIAHADHSKH